MRRLSCCLLVTILLVGGGFIAFGTRSAGAAASQSPNPAYNKEYAGFQKWVLRYGVATSDVTDPGYLKAKRAFDEALEKRDAKGVGALLNDNFQWIAWNGEIYPKAQIVSDPGVLDAFAADTEGDMDVRTVNFRGNVERVLGLHHNTRFVYLWANGASGWQAFVYLDIPIPKERRTGVDPPRPPKNTNLPCTNPCGGDFPFKPADAAQAQVLKNWIEMKHGEWHPNPELWSNHADIYHETISPGGDLPMLQHVAELSNARRLYGPKGSGPGQPVMKMNMYTFGNVVIQVDLEGQPAAVVKKPITYKLRLFVNRGSQVSGPKSDWRVCLSGQNRIVKNMPADEAKAYLQSIVYPSTN